MRRRVILSPATRAALFDPPDSHDEAQRRYVLAPRMSPWRSGTGARTTVSVSLFNWPSSETSAAPCKSVKFCRQP
jgi:hypothetical protein